MDGFWSKRCLNYRIDVPDKIGSISSGATTSMVVKNGIKKLYIFLVQNMSHGNCSTTFISQHLKLKAASWVGACVCVSVGHEFSNLN